MVCGIIPIAASCAAGVNQPVSPSDTGGTSRLPGYPPERFIVRTGTGPTTEAASDAARFEIAAFFESGIAGETVVSQWARSESSGGTLSEERMTVLSGTVSVAAGRDIPGIEIVRTERLEGSRDYRAWAALDRLRHAAFLGERIANLDEAVDSKRSAAYDDDLRAAAGLASILRDLNARERDRRDLAVVSSGMAPPTREPLMLAVLTSLDSLVTNALDVGLVFGPEMREDVKALIASGIADEGIRIVEYSDTMTGVNSGADLVVTVSMESGVTETANTISGREVTLQRVDWSMTMQAFDPGTFDIADTLVLRDRASGLDEKQAFDMMAAQVSNRHLRTISSWIYSVVFGPASGIGGRP